MSSDNVNRKKALERHYRLEQIGTWMGEATQILLGAQIAFGIGDDDATHDQLKRLTIIIKMIVATWNLHRHKEREQASDDETRKEAAE